jgi:hypothetical protein
VLALTDDPEARLFEGCNCPQMRNVVDLWHRLLDGDFDLAEIGFLEEVFDGSQILAYGIADVRQSVGLRGPLRPTPRQTRNRDTDTFFGLMKSDFVLHTRSSLLDDAVRRTSPIAVSE